MALNEAACLSYDVFAGDETPVKVLSDKFLVVRVRHRCQTCWGAIRKGARVRARREVDLDDRRVGTFYFCPTCCEAMAGADDDNGDAITYRATLGAVRAGTLPRAALRALST